MSDGVGLRGHRQRMGLSPPKHRLHMGHCPVFKQVWRMQKVLDATCVLRQKALKPRSTRVCLFHNRHVSVAGWLTQSQVTVVMRRWATRLVLDLLLSKHGA